MHRSNFKKFCSISHEIKMPKKLECDKYESVNDHSNFPNSDSNSARNNKMEN